MGKNIIVVDDKKINYAKLSNYAKNLGCTFELKFTFGHAATLGHEATLAINFFRDLKSTSAKTKFR